jgi:hypothetical protein
MLQVLYLCVRAADERQQRMLETEWKILKVGESLTKVAKDYRRMYKMSDVKKIKVI